MRVAREQYDAVVRREAAAVLRRESGSLAPATLTLLMEALAEQLPLSPSTGVSVASLLLGECRGALERGHEALPIDAITLLLLLRQGRALELRAVEELMLFAIGASESGCGMSSAPGGAVDAGLPSALCRLLVPLGDVIARAASEAAWARLLDPALELALWFLLAPSHPRSDLTGSEDRTATSVSARASAHRLVDEVSVAVTALLARAFRATPEPASAGATRGRVVRVEEAAKERPVHHVADGVGVPRTRKISYST